MKKTAIAILVLVMLSIVIFVFTGFFVVQPLGSFPNGITIWYWRSGLNISFVSSPDGELLKSGGGVSLFGRGMILGAITGIIAERIILRLPYSKMLYLISTKGAEFSQ